MKLRDLIISSCLITGIYMPSSLEASLSPFDYPNTTPYNNFKQNSNNNILNQIVSLTKKYGVLRDYEGVEYLYLSGNNFFGDMSFSYYTKDSVLLIEFAFSELYCQYQNLGTNYVFVDETSDSDSYAKFRKLSCKLLLDTLSFKSQ